MKTLIRFPRCVLVNPLKSMAAVLFWMALIPAAELSAKRTPAGTRISLEERPATAGR